jgi:hypothetical protein
MCHRHWKQQQAGKLAADSPTPTDGGALWKTSSLPPMPFMMRKMHCSAGPKALCVCAQGTEKMSHIRRSQLAHTVLAHKLPVLA